MQQELALASVAAAFEVKTLSAPVAFVNPPFVKYKQIII